MCEIFPEVDKCCICISPRLALLFISVLAIMTGVTILCGIEKVSNASYKKLKNITDIRDTQQAMSQISLIIPSGITAMAVVFMFTGVILLIAALGDVEGFAQVFVWVTFVVLILGLLMVVATGYECIMKPKCLLSSMDWLSGAVVLILIIAYMFLWLYFISIVNTYVLNMYA